MRSEPAGRDWVVHVATPLTRVTGRGHSGMALLLSVKVTVPVGVTPPGIPVTVAVKVTKSFKVEGFFDELSTVVLGVLASLIMMLKGWVTFTGVGHSESVTSTVKG